VRRRIERPRMEEGESLESTGAGLSEGQPLLGAWIGKDSSLATRYDRGIGGNDATRLDIVCLPKENGGPGVLLVKKGCSGGARIRKFRRKQEVAVSSLEAGWPLMADR
jgi:hypothetical protein